MDILLETLGILCTPYLCFGIVDVNGVNFRLSKGKALASIVGCLPLRYNGDPDVMKLHLLRCNCTAASSVKQHKLSSSGRALTSRPPSNCSLGGNLTYFDRQISLSQGWRREHVATFATSSVLTHVSASCACLKGGVV